MKRIALILLIIAMLAELTGCGGSVVPPNTSETPATTPTAVLGESISDDEQPTVEMLTGVENTTLVDDENCAFSIRSVALSDYAGMELEVECVNKTDHTLIFSWTGVSVCGYQCDCSWSLEVAPGQQTNSIIGIDTYQLETWGVTSADQVGFDLNVFDSEDFMAEPYVSGRFEIFPTGLSADAVVYPTRVEVEGEQVVAQANGVSFIIEGFDMDAGSYNLHCYLENQTSETLMFTWEDVSVNSVAADPVWAELLVAGCRTYAEISFPASLLEQIEITEVEQIDFRLNVVNEEQCAVFVDQNFTFNPENSTVG